MLQLGLCILPGLAFANLTASLPSVMLASQSEGTVSAFGYAYRLHQSAIHILVVASSPVILAHFSSMIAKGNHIIVYRVMEKAALFSFLLGAGAVIGVWWLGSPFLQLVFGQGHFDAEAADRVARHWCWLSLGLAPALLGNILAKSLQASGLPKIMSLLSGLGLLTLLIGFFVLKPLIDAYSVPASLTCSSIVVTFFAWYIAKHLFVVNRRKNDLKENLQYGE
jgi:peptidoglycan biosynthesis protein MviN/MurJ (putative lipid II flippase)